MVDAQWLVDRIKGQGHRSISWSATVTRSCWRRCSAHKSITKGLIVSVRSFMPPGSGPAIRAVAPAQLPKVIHGPPPEPCRL